MINKKYVSAAQAELIRNHIEEARRREKEGTYPGHASCGDYWDIYETDELICGDTMMDNFNMEHYLIHVVGINPEHIDIGR
jgi:hypothetical protein